MKKCIKKEVEWSSRRLLYNYFSNQRSRAVKRKCSWVLGHWLYGWTWDWGLIATSGSGSPRPTNDLITIKSSPAVLSVHGPCLNNKTNAFLHNQVGRSWREDASGTAACIYLETATQKCRKRLLFHAVAFFSLTDKPVQWFIANGLYFNKWICVPIDC